MAARKIRDGYAWIDIEAELRHQIQNMVNADPFASVRGIEQEIGRWSFGGISVQWKCGWAANADVRIGFENDEETIKGERYIFRSVRCQVSWSSSNWTIAQAVAVHDIHDRAIKFAAAIENMFSDEYWIPDLEPVSTEGGAA